MTDADYEARIAVLEEAADMLRQDLVRAQVTLRDQFAGQALMGLLQFRTGVPDEAVKEAADAIARCSYFVADAMLEARKEKGHD
jgi:hypothetical protein